MTTATHLTIEDLNNVWPSAQTYRIKANFGEKEHTALSLSSLDGYAALVGLVKAQAKGSYQDDLVNGDQRWSGSDLQGNAGRYRSRYEASRRALVKRINKALTRSNMTAAISLVFDESTRRWSRCLTLATPDTFYVWGC